MTVDLATVGSFVGAVGLGALMLAPARSARAAGLVGWALGAGMLALSVAPHGHHAELAAAALVGVAGAAALGWLFVRVPWALAVAVLACAPARIPVSRLGSAGGAKANLLLPLYVVVAGAALSLAWQLYRGDQRRRELGPFAWPLGLFVCWDGLALSWSAAGAGQGRHAGAVDLLFYVLPLGLLAVSLARLPWSLAWAKRLYIQLAAMALAFAAIAVWQYFAAGHLLEHQGACRQRLRALTLVFPRQLDLLRPLDLRPLRRRRDRRSSLVLVLFGPGRAAWAGAGVASAAMIGLIPSFSQSSFVALGAVIVGALMVLWRRRAVAPLVGALVVALALSLGVPQIRHRILGNAGISRATGGRSSLVKQGAKLFLHHPLVGVGTGSFAPALAAVTPGHSVKLVRLARRADHRRGRDGTARACPARVAARAGVHGALPAQSRPAARPPGRVCASD